MDGGGADRELPVTDALRERYEAYRRSQGRALLAMVPREGLRALLRSSGVSTIDDSGASLDLLAVHCADLLPLPPLLDWARDFERNRAAYGGEVLPSDAGPRSPDGTPVAVAVRSFREAGREWVARLVVRPRVDGWEGSIEFPQGDGARPTRTAAVFREATVPAIRDRFDSFDQRTLSAFLRSTRP